MIEALALLTFFQVSPAPGGAGPETRPFVGHWLVEMLDNIQILPESRVTLSIEGGVAADQFSISGTAPCNTYRGTLRTNDSDGMRVSQVLKTLKGCDTARMSEEKDFFRLLGDVDGYEVRGQILMLKTHAGKIITARRETR